MKAFKATVFSAFVAVVLGVVFHALSLKIYIDELRTIVRRRIEHLSWSIPTTIYTSPFILYVGQDTHSADVLGRLYRLGYTTATRSRPRPGELIARPSRIVVNARPTLLPSGPRESALITLEINGRGNLETIAVGEGPARSVVPTFELEPETLSHLFSDTIEKRQIVGLDQVPPLLLDALILIEDSRFLSHTGIDIRGILRAVWHDIRTGALAQGGSTLTQQLVKNFFLTSQRKWSRKVNEALMSILLEQEYSKDQILEAYLNEVYFGQDGAYPIHGVQEASLFYFSKDVKDLDVSEIALLVALVRGPNLYSPATAPDSALKRRNLILARLLEKEFISKTQHAQAVEDPLPQVPRSRVQRRTAPYFVDYVVSTLVPLMEQKAPAAQGLHVFTTLDPVLQARAMQGFDDIMRKHPKTIEGAFLLADQGTGSILALTGGRDYATSQFNRATQARRQPGSLFKPVVYLEALVQTLAGRGPFYENTILDDSEFTWNYEGQSWTPKNFDHKFHGKVALGTALLKSYNVATARLGEQLGLSAIADRAIALGFEGPIPLVPSIVLGSASASLAEVTTVFGSLANQCFQFPLFPIRAVYGPHRELLYSHESEPHEVAPPRACVVLSEILRHVFSEGTASAFMHKKWASVMAGKTGTTSEHRDAWFAGFDPRWTLVTWLGSDIPQPTALTGASGALPLWASIIDRIHPLRPIPAPTPLPNGILRGKVPDAEKGCSQPQTILYFEQAPPRDLCDR